MPIVEGVDMPDWGKIQIMCMKKMIQKAKTKGNTWRRQEYVKDDPFLYEEMLSHAFKLNPSLIKNMTKEQIISNAIDVINFNAMIIENADAMIAYFNSLSSP